MGQLWFMWGPDATKPLTEPMLAPDYWHPFRFIFTEHAQGVAIKIINLSKDKRRTQRWSNDLLYCRHVYRDGERTGVGDPGMISRITTMCTEKVRGRVLVTQGWSNSLPACVQRWWEDECGWPRDDLTHCQHVYRDGERTSVGDPGMIYRITTMCTEKVRGREWVTQGWSIVLPPCVQRRWWGGCEWPMDDLSYYHHVYRKGERPGMGDPGMIYRITTMCTEKVRGWEWVTQGWSISLPPCVQRWWEDGC